MSNTWRLRAACSGAVTLAISTAALTSTPASAAEVTVAGFLPAVRISRMPAMRG